MKISLNVGRLIYSNFKACRLGKQIYDSIRKMVSRGFGDIRMT